MNAGDFDRRITLETNEGGLDALGGVVSDWTEVATVWAKFTPVNDGEQWRAGQVENRSLAWFRVYASTEMSAINTKDRILMNGEYWSITGIKEAERGRQLEFTAEKTDG